MNINEYLVESERTVSSDKGVSFAHHQDSEAKAMQSIVTIMRSAITADCVKRGMFYHEEKAKTEDRYVTDMQEFANIFQALREQDPETLKFGDTINLTHACLGIVSEAGEIIKEIMLSRIQGREIDKANIKEELGDIQWYLALAIRVLEGETFETIGYANIKKLYKRYPDKFDSSHALKRDIEAEKVALTS